MDTINRNIIIVSLKIPALLISVLVIALTNFAKANPQRVAQIDFDLREVFKLYSSPGRDTSIYFPCNIEYATGGTAEDLKLSLPKKFPNLLTVFILHGRAESTSFKVFCADNVFVFDLVPSQENHIDFLKITKTHGELPHFRDVESSALFKLKPIENNLEKVSKRLIYSSKTEKRLEK